MNNGFYEFSRPQITSSVFPYTGSAIISGSLTVIGSAVATSFTGSLQGVATQAVSASYSNNSTSASYSISSSQSQNAISSSYSLSSSYAVSSSYSVSSSYALNASTASFAPAYLPLTGGTIAGSLTINNNLTVLGSASIQYVSESVLNIGTNLITVNTATPAVRFGGLAVIDSGSSPQVSASFLYDSVQDEFLFVHKGTAAGAITSSVFLLGPETYNNLGNETYLTANRIPKGTGIEHLNDSNISDNGSIVSINSNTEITGSLNVTQGITGSLFGTASFASTASFVSIPTFTNGSVLFSNGSTLAQDNANLFWDDTNNRLGIGTNAPAHKLHITGVFESYTNGLVVENTGNASAANKNVAAFVGNRGNASNIDDNTNIGIQQKSNIANNYGLVNFFNAGGNLSAFFGCQYVNHSTGQSGNFIFGTTNSGTVSEKMRISAVGNVLIGTTTDSGFRLDVNGTTRLNGNTSIGGAAAGARLDVRAQGALSTDIAFRVRNSADSANLVTVQGNGNVGIGNKTFSTYSSGGPTANDCLKLELTSDGAVLGLQNSNASGFSGVEYLNQSGAARVFTGFNNANGQEFRFNNFATGGYIDFLISATSALRIANSRNILIGTTTDSSFRLDVSGSTRLNGNTTITGSLNITGSSTLRGTVNITPTTSTANSLVVTGPTLLSGSQNTISGSVLTVVGSGSAQPVFTVQGSQGELFSITDSLSGSLFSVNDISGLPIMEVFSDGTTLMGDYLDPMLITTKKVTLTNSGSFTIYSLPTASYDTAFFDYSVRSGSNARAGQIMAIQSASVVNYTETTTMDFGSTSGITLGVFISGSNMVLTGSAATSAWTIKTIIRSL